MSKKNPPRHPMKGKVRKEPPRFLAANPGASGPRYLRDQKGELILDENDRPQLDPKDDGVRDYTTRRDKAVFGEGECPPATLVDEYAKENNNRFSALKAEEHHRREGRSAAARVRELYALARKQGGGVPEIWQAIEDAEKRLKEAA